MGIIIKYSFKIGLFSLDIYGYKTYYIRHSIINAI